MAEYTKPWLSLEQQVERLASRGVDLGTHDRAAAVLKAIGYYRLTGYLYPFRKSEQYIDDEGRERTRVLNDYRPGTTTRGCSIANVNSRPSDPRQGRSRYSTTSATRRPPRESSARTTPSP